MQDSTHIKGLSDLQRFLDQVAPNIERNYMRGALRAGMNVVKPAAEANIHSVSHLLAANLKLGTSAKGGVVTAYLKATGPHAPIASLVEFGTHAHNIAAKTGWLYFGGTFARQVIHPGAKPHPFMRPALDSQATSAVVAAGEYLKEKLSTKQGFDTSGVQIIGDVDGTTDET